ncbi:hypothetical protein JS528_09520 [Bifidobacterium sp. MA2]|uniref:Tox-PL domain-containing protein n=1 Tax=Bifidobacterium santillanense TaxID=2809028 RepID=A0ABS5US01_9BIFI|nr:toxin glutamine deamidase domain-containing protein [Bifidobacterium santillanense]MBT1173573.1 hypothetical protein [Bifidobacterium santillanense]
MDSNSLPLSNLSPAQRKAFNAHLNDLWDDYQEQLSDLILEAKTMVPNATYDEEGAAAARALLDDYSRQANIIANDYYRNVRAAWAEAANADLGDFTESQVSGDRAFWQVAGGYNSTDFTGLKFTDVVNGRSKAGLTMDDLWAMKTKDYTDEDWATLAKDMINANARLTTMFNVKNDPTKPRYARVPQGKTCAFCSMLASRGFVYLSEDTAGKWNKYHSNCDCKIVPSWGKTQIDGYDPSKLYDMWKKSTQGGGGMKAALARMRRNFADLLTDGVFPKTETRSPELDKLYKTGKPLQSLSQLTAKIVNPHIGTTAPGIYDAYANNCQRCCQIAELRLRGYDVTAAPLGKNDHSNYSHLYISNWQTRDGKQRRWTDGAPRRNATSILEELNAYPVGARFFIRGQWQTKWGGGGHVWNAEIVMENGKKTIKMHDLQGDGRDPDKYLSRVKRGKSAYIRVDDMVPSDALAPDHDMNFGAELPTPNPWVIGEKDHAPTVDEANAKRWDITDQQLIDSWHEYVDWDYSDPSVPAIAPDGKEIKPQE